jgi:uncharacterized protein YcbK (DUF882 family)
VAIVNALRTRRSFLRAAAASAGAIATGLPAVGPARAAPFRSPLALYNTHTGDRVRVEYRRPDGLCDADALAALNRVLRCHATGEVTEMDVRVIDFVSRVNQALGNGLVHVISGYRSPEYNARLARQGRGVAPNSLHLRGQALDIRIPHVPLGQVRQVALGLRAGGVGYYPDSGFVHLDSGRVRAW